MNQKYVQPTVYHRVSGFPVVKSMAPRKYKTEPNSTATLFLSLSLHTLSLTLYPFWPLTVHSNCRLHRCKVTTTGHQHWHVDTLHSARLGSDRSARPPTSLPPDPQELWCTQSRWVKHGVVSWVKTFTVTDPVVVLLSVEPVECNNPLVSILNFSDTLVADSCTVRTMFLLGSAIEQRYPFWTKWWSMRTLCWFSKTGVPANIALVTQYHCKSLPCWGFLRFKDVFCFHVKMHWITISSVNTSNLFPTQVNHTHLFLLSLSDLLQQSSPLYRLNTIFSLVLSFNLIGALNGKLY